MWQKKLRIKKKKRSDFKGEIHRQLDKSIIGMDNLKNTLTTPTFNVMETDLMKKGLN